MAHQEQEQQLGVSGMSGNKRRGMHMSGTMIQPRFNSGKKRLLIKMRHGTMMEIRRCTRRGKNMHMSVTLMHNSETLIWTCNFVQGTTQNRGQK